MFEACVSPYETMLGRSQGKVPFLAARDYFCSVSHFDFGVRRAADHPVNVAVERQARGGFRFHTFRASVVVDGAARPHDAMRERCDISIIDRKLVDDARPFGILCMPSTLF
jgi:hypothetical protein